MRPNLIAARKAKEWDQQMLADRVGVRRQTVSEWENQDKTIRSYYMEPLREHLENKDPHLFEIVSSNTEPCHTSVVGDTVSSADPFFDIHGSGKEPFMDKIRRLILSTLGLTLVGNVSVIMGPIVEPEEYLAQCRIALDDCWTWLHQGNYDKSERSLQAHMPTLKRLATSVWPQQDIAAKLAMQAKILQIYLAKRELDFVGAEFHGAEAVRLGQLSGDRHMYAVALEWHGYTYTTCYHRSQRAIALFTDALARLNGDTSLSKADISIGLALAYAQDETQEDYETKAREFLEQAHIAMPDYPKIDPFYQCTELGHSELDQLEGKVYLYLAEHLPASDYAQKAYDAIEKSINKQAKNQGYLGGALIKKADAARVLGELRNFIDALTEGFHIMQGIDSKRGMGEAHDIMGHIPPSWQHETAIQNLQKDIGQALIIARQ